MFNENSLPAVDASLVDGLTALAAKAAAAIGEVARTAYAVERKSDGSPVTAADRASDAVICDGLRRLLPGLLVVSEESGKRPASIARDTSFMLVDPLDGTKEFLERRDEFTVNLALIVDGRPAVGIIAAPALGLLYRGIVGRGAQRLSLVAATSANRAAGIVDIKTRPAPKDGLSVLVSRSHLEPTTEAFLKRFAGFTKIPCGSSLKFCRIAEGAADLYPRLSRTSEWDIAAGDAILTAAGGLVTTPEGGPLLYGQAAKEFRVPGFVAWADPARARQEAAAHPGSDHRD